MGVEYPLTCECGKVSRVGAGDAGAELPCGCGRVLQVPELHVMRQAYRIVVHSSRCRSTEGRKAVEDWLIKHQIVVDEVCEHKPPAMLYVDDRAVRFRGDWDLLFQEIRQFRK